MIAVIWEAGTVKQFGNISVCPSRKKRRVQVFQTEVT